MFLLDCWAWQEKKCKPRGYESTQKRRYKIWYSKEVQFCSSSITFFCFICLWPSMSEWDIGTIPSEWGHKALRWCGFARFLLRFCGNFYFIFIFICGIAVLRNKTVCGFPMLFFAVFKRMSVLLSGVFTPPPPPLRPPPISTLKLNWDTTRYHRTEQLRHPETQTDLPMNGLKNCLLRILLGYFFHYT